MSNACCPDPATLNCSAGYQTRSSPLYSSLLYTEMYHAVRACLQAAHRDVQAHVAACLSSFMDAFASADPVAVSSHRPTRRDYGPTAVDCLTTHDDLRDAVELLLATTKLGCEDQPAQAWRMLCDQVSRVGSSAGLSGCPGASKQGASHAGPGVAALQGCCTFGDASHVSPCTVP